MKTMDIPKTADASAIFKWASEHLIRAKDLVDAANRGLEDAATKVELMLLPEELITVPHYWRDKQWQPVPPNCWFHGGRAGLRVGDWILPQSATGVGTWTTVPENPHTDFTFVTPYKGLALAYGIGVPSGGSLYRVRPDPPLFWDRVSMIEYCCRRAEVLEVVVESIRYSDFEAVADDFRALLIDLGSKNISNMSNPELWLLMKRQGIERAAKRAANFRKVA